MCCYCQPLLWRGNLILLHYTRDYKLHPCNLSFGLHKTHSILLLAKLVLRYRLQWRGFALK